MSTNPNPEPDISGASGTITVGDEKQTCWFCSARGHILTAGHIFFERRDDRRWQATAKKGDAFEVEFEDQGIREAELIEEPCLDEGQYLDFAVLRLTAQPIKDVPFLPLCSHESCRTENMQFVFDGYRKLVGRDLTWVTGVLKKEMPKSAVVRRFQVTQSGDSDVQGLSGAAARAYCRASGTQAAFGIQSLQAAQDGKELFVVPSARLIEASRTLRDLYDPRFWTNREWRLALLRILRGAIIDQESPWNSPDTYLSAVFREDLGECVGPGVTCSKCKECALGFLGEPNPKTLAELIEYGRYTCILLYGSRRTGKTRSSDSLYVAERRRPSVRGRDIKIVLIDVGGENLLDHARENMEEPEMITGEAFSYPFLDAFLVELLRTAMDKLDTTSGWFRNLSEEKKRTWCERQLLNCLTMNRVKRESASGNLVLGLKAVLAAIVPTNLGIGDDVRIIIYLDNAHLIDEYMFREHQDRGLVERPHQPVNELLKQNKQQTLERPPSDKRGDIPRNRHFVITTRHVPEIISSRSPEALSSKVRALPISDVAYIDENQICSCLESRSNMWKASGSWRSVANRIHSLTNGHPWFVHSFLQFYDCILSNTSILDPMIAADTVAVARFLWTHYEPLHSREICLQELEKEINCLERKEEYSPDTVDLHELARGLIEQSERFSAEKIAPELPNSVPGEDRSYASPRPEDVGKVLPAVCDGFVADRKQADEWCYANMIVAIHFAVKPITSKGNEDDVAEHEGPV